ncbi:MAG: DUF3108 domain-containing protein [Bacteroides sp.]
MKRKNLELSVEGGKQLAKWTLVLILFLTGSIPYSLGQCKIKNSVIRPGEEIKYDLYFHWGFVWKNAGEAVLNTYSTNYDGQSAYKMELLATSNKSADVLFRLRDTLTCIVDTDLVPLYYRKGAEEGKRYTVDQAKYSYKNNKTYVKQRRTWKDGKVKDTEFESNDCVYDMLSILAKSRNINPEKYNKGDRIHFPMATGRRMDNIILEFRGKQNVKTNDGTKFRCIVVGLIGKTKKNKEKDLITFYISDDDNHLPVKVDFNLNFGSAQVTLKSLNSHKYPLSSIVK